MDPTQKRIQNWMSTENIEFMNKNAEKLYQERAKRVADVVQLRMPDRVPVELCFGVFPALDNGYTAEDILFDREKVFNAYKKSITDFEVDTFRIRTAQGTVLDMIKSKQVRLPGRGISVNSNLQFVETECASADEFYAAFIEDPTGFMIHTHLPRIIGILEPIQQLPPIDTGFSYYLGIIDILSGFGMPGVAEAFQKMCEAGILIKREAKLAKEKSIELMQMGFPLDTGGGSHAPFDTIGDFIRGTRGIMLDMYRRPEMLIAAMEKMVPMMIRMGMRAKNSHSPFVFMPLHKGIDSFMSLEQYKTFYWPTLRKVVMGLINEGLIPILFFEGDNTSRLEVIRDIPKGKAVYQFERVNLRKAKEILGDTVCFRGNVPISLLCTGTPQDVADYVKKLIDIVGKNGGLIVDSGAFIDEAKHENVEAMVKMTKTYGVYH